MIDKAHAEIALAELVYRNQIRSDAHSYELNLALWGLGIIDKRPAPEDYGQDEVSEFDAASYARKFTSQ